METPTNTQVHDYMTIPEVAAELRLNRRTVLTLIRQARFPSAFRAGRDWRVPASDVEAYIASTRVGRPQATAPDHSAAPSSPSQ